MPPQNLEDPADTTEQAHQLRLRREREHFNAVAYATGETGHQRDTVAGLRRMRRRGALCADLLRELSTPRALELGIGAGAFSAVLLEEIPDLHLTGVDVSDECVAIAKRRFAPHHSNAVFVTGDCSKLDFPDSSFDVVCGCSVLHHLPVEQALSECHRVLRPGGRIWFSEPNMLNPQIALQKNIMPIKLWLGDTPDETAFFRWEITNKMRLAGFTGIQVEPFDFLHPLVPGVLVGIADSVCRLLERTPAIREIAGSLVLNGQRVAEHSHNTAN